MYLYISLMPDKNKMIWGKATWMLFHILAERINPVFYFNNKRQVLGLVKAICSKLPCPTCTTHAMRFMSRVNVSSVPTKTQFRAMLYYFHNKVNLRLGKPQFKFRDLTRYKTFNLGIALSNFLVFYAKRYNGTIQVGVTSTEIARRKIAQSALDWFKTSWRWF